MQAGGDPSASGNENLHTSPDEKPLYNFASGDSYRWYLQVLMPTEDMMQSFEPRYAQDVRRAFESNQKKRLYVDLTAKESSISLGMAFRVARMILTNRKYTAEIYDSVVIVLPDDKIRADTIRSILTKVFALVKNNLSPIRVYINKEKAKEFHLSNNLPVKNHAEFVY